MTGRPSNGDGGWEGDGIELDLDPRSDPGALKVGPQRELSGPEVCGEDPRGTVGAAVGSDPCTADLDPRGTRDSEPPVCSALSRAFRRSSMSIDTAPRGKSTALSGRGRKGMEECEREAERRGVRGWRSKEWRRHMTSGSVGGWCRVNHPRRQTPRNGVSRYTIHTRYTIHPRQQTPRDGVSRYTIHTRSSHCQR